MGDEVTGVFLVDLTKRTDREKEDLKWLALAQYLDGKRCAVCGHLYDSRDAVEAHNPKQGYGEDIVGKECWDTYITNRE